MNSFFPVGSVSTSASASFVAAAIPTGGPMIRIARETSSVRLFITFGVLGVVGTTNGMELVSGIVEELENPNPNIYTHFSVITDAGTCGVNISAGPRYSLT